MAAAARTNRIPTNYRVRLMTTQPTYGGRRYWFLCPLGRSDDGPPRRVAKLYLPPGGKYFGSRQAHGLTSPTSRARRAANTMGSIGDWLPRWGQMWLLLGLL